MKSPASVAEIGPGVTPGRRRRQGCGQSQLPCGNACEFCLEGQPNHCLDMRFYGSAMRIPPCARRLPRATRLPGEPSRIRRCRGRTWPRRRSPSRFRYACTPHGRRDHSRENGCWCPGGGRSGRSGYSWRGTAGAAEIIVTDLLDEPLALVRSFGADRTINHGRAA